MPTGRLSGFVMPIPAVGRVAGGRLGGLLLLGTCVLSSSIAEASGVGAWVRAQAAIAKMEETQLELEQLARKRAVRRSQTAAACLASNSVSVGVFLDIAQAAQSEIAEAAAMGDNAQVARSWRSVVEVEAQVRKIGEAPLSCPFLGVVEEDGNRLVSKPSRK